MSAISLLTYPASSAAISATENLKRQDIILLSTADLRGGTTSDFTTAGSSMSLATLTDAPTAYILTESLSSYSNAFRIGNRKLFAKS